MGSFTLGRLALGGAVVGAVALGAVVPMLTNVVWDGIATQVLIYACGALGLTMVFGFAGQISVVQAGFMGVGAYAPAIIAIKYGASPWLGLPAGIAGAMLLALIVGVPVLRLEGLYLAMATTALNLVMVVVAMQLTEFTGGPFGIAGLHPLEFFGLSLVDPDHLYYAVFVSFLVLLLSAYRLITSPVGGMLAALRHDPQAAALAGIPVLRLKIKIFVLSAAYAAVGGFFLAEFLLVVTPESYGVFPSLLFLLMVVVGGTRSIPGALVGAAFVVIVPQVIPDYPREQQLLFATAFLLIVVFIPNGLAGVVDSLFRVLRRAWAVPAANEVEGDPL